MFGQCINDIIEQIILQMPVTQHQAMNDINSKGGDIKSQFVVDTSKLKLVCWTMHVYVA